MARNDIPDALQHFRASLELAPYWYFTHINLGVAYQHVGQMDSARVYFDRGVEYDRYSGMGLTHRGEFRLAVRDYEGARDDFVRSSSISLDRYRNTRGLATAFAGLGNVAQCLEATQRLISLDSAAALADIPGISTPFFEVADLHAAGIAFYEALGQRLPGTQWIPENINRLRALANRTGTGASRSSAVQLASQQPPGGSVGAQPDAQQTLMAAGLRLLQNGKPAEAATSFRRVLALNPLHYGAHYQLAVALERSGNATEARMHWQTVLQMAERYHDASTAQTARTHLRVAPPTP
jgi:tetratricopeptide (TPR) repeat protein